MLFIIIIIMVVPKSLSISLYIQLVVKYDQKLLTLFFNYIKVYFFKLVFFTTQRNNIYLRISEKLTIYLFNFNLNLSQLDFVRLVSESYLILIQNLDRAQYEKNNRLKQKNKLSKLPT